MSLRGNTVAFSPLQSFPRSVSRGNPSKNIMEDGGGRARERIHRAVLSRPTPSPWPSDHSQTSLPSWEVLTVSSRAVWKRQTPVDAGEWSRGMDGGAGKAWE